MTQLQLGLPGIGAKPVETETKPAGTMPAEKMKTCIKTSKRKLLPVEVCIAHYFTGGRKCRQCLGLQKGQDFPEPWASSRRSTENGNQE